ncbi:hypothetical protein DID88_008354 [Monilinia fructigena]|uniref:Uncharacterized protein n=1 Tax=Monilinia fructigena TaxID=38457 RepID=A0A395J5H9_9HELO|nr:hypothetical protein DID88_008354 [Monilinia fructigena]
MPSNRNNKTGSDATRIAIASTPPPRTKRNMASTFKSLLDSAKQTLSGQSAPIPGTASGNTPIEKIFPKVDPAVDGDDCDHDCASCHVKYPKGFKIDEDDKLYGHVKGWSTHILVATGKSDWVRDVADEKGSVMQAIDHGSVKPSNGKLMLSASNIPTPSHSTDYSQPTTVILLPAFVVIENKTRDARCGQSAPLLRKEFERHLRPLGLFRDLDDERPGGVGIYFISHVGGHKYSANVMIYRRSDAFGLDSVARAKADGDVVPSNVNPSENEDKGAAQCMWLARVKPEDCEGIIKFTVLQGN